MRRVLTSLTATLLAVGLLSACQAEDNGAPSASGGDGGGGGATAVERTPVSVTTNVTNPDSVPVDEEVTISADGGTLESVTVTSDVGELAGAMQQDSWRATGRLEPGTDYLVRAAVRREDGTEVTRRQRFHTADLTLDQQTYPAVAPLAGETVGVGMPVVVTFDLPVQDKALFERHMDVTSTPRQPGSWYWLSDTEAHWRPRTYWKAGSDVSVDIDVNSLPAGGGIYGQESRTIDFHVGDSVVSRVDVDAHVMRTFVNGALARTIPISAGKAGWETRSGTKVIIEKFRRKRMNAATIGVSEDDPEYYDLSNVQYALRVTYSGEFLHAAPWSVGSQGSANVSHGCVGMSVADAAWLYDRTTRGDVVEVTGSARQMTLTNGYGDWNLSPADWKTGSALS
jgi:lipoprotein-anchoring transpeptidase ErfK/SrfK